MKKYFGEFGGQFIPETGMQALYELENAFVEAKSDKKFLKEFKNLLQDYVGRESPLFYAKNLSERFGQNIYLKREDLNHTGSHKVNNALFQAMLAKKMGKKRIIAETGAGQHGVATATIAALLGLECEVFMGAEDIKRQSLNVYKMQLLGAKVTSVEDGNKTLKEATTAALRIWIERIYDTHYVIGSAVGPYPYPQIVSYAQGVIGKEAKKQLKKIGVKANHIIACVGGGSNAIGIFNAFLSSKAKLYGVEAGGIGDEIGEHAATLTYGNVGVMHGMKSVFLQDKYGKINEVHSISAGLDYPGIGPAHSHLHKSGRVEYVAVKDAEALEALELISRLEGIIPALESAHALAFLPKLAKRLKKAGKRENILVNISGRGDKDMHTIREKIKL